MAHAAVKSISRMAALQQRWVRVLGKPDAADNVARARELLGEQKPQAEPVDADHTDGNDTSASSQPCPCCGGRMIIIETFNRGSTPRYQPTAPIIAIRIDTS